MGEKYSDSRAIEEEADMIFVIEDDEALTRLIQKNLQRASFHPKGSHECQL